MPLMVVQHSVSAFAYRPNGPREYPKFYPSCRLSMPTHPEDIKHATEWQEAADHAVYCRMSRSESRTHQHVRLALLCVYSCDAEKCETSARHRASYIQSMLGQTVSPAISGRDR
eukprot:scaffold249327_cov23-Prasinocladus_malaysianus.AAC.1